MKVDAKYSVAVDLQVRVYDFSLAVFRNILSHSADMSIYFSQKEMSFQNQNTQSLLDHQLWALHIVYFSSLSIHSLARFLLTISWADSFPQPVLFHSILNLLCLNFFFIHSKHFTTIMVVVV